jgi:two-component system heavy metal sensor histidine kinase CusS
MSSISLNRRLSTALFFQSAALLAAAALSILWLTNESLAQRRTEQLESKKVLLRHLASEVRSEADLKDLGHKVEDFAVGPRSIRTIIVGPAGETLVDTRSQASDAKQALVPQAIFELPIERLGSALKVSMWIDDGEDRQLIRRITGILLMIWIAGALAAASSVRWISRHALMPVAVLTTQIAQIDARIPKALGTSSGVPIELEPIVKVINDLVERVDEALQQLQRFNGNVAHELRTPLASMLGAAEVALRRPRTAAELSEVLESVMHDGRRLSRIVSDMLLLARADRGEVIRSSSRLTLRGIVLPVVDLHRDAADGKAVELTVAGDAVVRGDTGLLQRAIDNLIANAVRFAPANTEVVIRMEQHAGATLLVVENTLQEPSAIDPARLFDRFYRGRQDESREQGNAATHVGLGLAIVKAIAVLHGGRPFAELDSHHVRIGFSISALGAS